MKILEITKTLMGESQTQGEQCLLIRLAGCNLNCSYCDTPQKNDTGEEISTPELVNKVIDANIPTILITGGEPFLQPSEVHSFVKRLVDIQLIKIEVYTPFRIVIETNGSLSFSEHDRAYWGDFVSIIADIKTPSSGEVGKTNWEMINNLYRHDEIKFVISSLKDLDFVKQVIPRLETRVKNYIISPVPDGSGLLWKEVATWVRDIDLFPEHEKWKRLKLQVQLHKLLKIE